MTQNPRKSPESEPKQPEFKFRTRPVAERSIFESWAVLPAKTRLRVSLAITAFAALGLFVSDRLEKAIPGSEDSSKPSTAPPPSS